MSRYTAVTSTPASPRQSSSGRASLHSSRRPSLSLRFSRRQESRVPDPDEMDAAFDAPPDADDDENENENSGLLGRENREAERNGRIPGEYNFDHAHTQPLESPPPFQDYSSHNPAPGNTNGISPMNTVRPTAQSRHFLGGILPSSFLPRQPSVNANGRVIGAGNSGIFTNLSARPTTGPGEQRQDGPEYAPEDEQKDGPPSYHDALRDAVPTYWDTTVVLPSNNSPFGPLTSSLSGDEILIDGMPSGNFFGFLWNMIVSFSFQFVGFLLTYVLHTTHTAKYGSRVGLGFTMIQFGFNLRAKAEELIESGKFPTDPSDPDPFPGANQDEIEADNAIAAFWGNNSPWPQPVRDPDHPDAPPTILHNTHDAELWAIQHNTTLHKLMQLPSAEEVGRANEWFSFLLMSIGWFLILTSLGGLWRVKRFEKGLRDAQRESERAQAAANGGTGSEEITTTTPEVTGPGPTNLAYYTASFNQALEGARGIQRGFFGMNGRRTGHAPLPQDEDVELFDADRFERPMAGNAGDGRQRGLWG